ncbi:hypothetical protein WJX81_006077 [Elliptochloris bilobata]|uniref:Zinc-finger domain-containing protein n=1 Tax=Elliptochloris bilobata TaxID=381761 RepID=A0AAW1RDA5_9CHLO
MSALCEYEVERERRVAENKRRMEEMGIAKLSADMMRRQNAEQAAKRAVRRPASAYAPSREPMDGPKRRSSRIEGKPARNYSENELAATERPEQRSRLHDRHTVTQEEVYTQEHVALLGSYQEPWTLFVDGYDVSGNRVYDKVSGQTCHQCRQKTLGRHTSCAECQTLHGVFCGDCLFMRYGENIVELGADWVCPPCRGLCNCSFHRIRRGWAPTGTLYRRALAEGYKSVAHYLVLTKLEGAGGEAHPADGNVAADQNAAADLVLAEPVGQHPRRGALRQTELTAVLAQTRSGGVAKAGTKAGAAKGKAAPGKAAALAAAVVEGLGRALRERPAPAAAAGCKRTAGGEAVSSTRRSARTAVAA